MRKAISFFLITMLILFGLALLFMQLGFVDKIGLRYAFPLLPAALLASVIVGTVVSLVFGHIPLRPIREMIAATNQPASALCAAYFVKLYCDTRNIPTEHIRLSQNNIVDPENRYQQTFKIQVELPPDISEKDRQGILRSIERCTVKKVVQTGPEFIIEEVENLDADAQALLTINPDTGKQTHIAGKDLPLEQTIANMSGVLAGLGMKIEIASWRNIVPNV